jgi:hypothetical protein
VPLVPSVIILPSANVDASFVGTNVGNSQWAGTFGRVLPTHVGPTVPAPSQPLMAVGRP